MQLSLKLEIALNKISSDKSRLQTMSARESQGFFDPFRNSQKLKAKPSDLKRKLEANNK
jgi:hypothetical protein